MFLLAIIVGCNDVYDAPPKSLMQVTLVNDDTLDISIPIVSVYGVGHADSLWIYQAQTRSFLLQLSTDTVSRFVVILDSLKNNPQIDTLTIYQEPQLIFESAETGFYFDYKIKDIDYTHRRLVDDEVTDSLVTRNWHENIQLYISPLPANAN